MEPSSCHLERAVGREAACPGDPCPFWADSRCVIEGLRSDLGSRPDVAELLLEIRRRLGVPAERALLPPGLRA